jgi:hypothetical protein
VCTCIEILVPVVLSLLLWLIYYFVDEDLVGPVRMQSAQVAPIPLLFTEPRNIRERDRITQMMSAQPNIDMPLALQIAGQKIAIVKGESVTEADVTSFVASLDRSFPGFDLAEATLGGCANVVWDAQPWQEALTKDLPSYIDAPTLRSNVTIPKLSDRVHRFEANWALERYCEADDYEHDIYAAIVLNEAGNAGNAYRWRYTLRLHNFRGAGVKTEDGNSDNPLSPKPKIKSLTDWFRRAPWQTGVASSSGGDRRNERDAREDRTFERVPLPSLGALQVVVDRAIIDSTEAFSDPFFSPTTLTEMSLRATAQGSPTDPLFPSLLKTVAHPVFHSVLGLATWDDDETPTNTTPMCFTKASLTPTQSTSLAAAYAKLIWAARGRVPHSAEVVSMPGLEYLDPTFYSFVAFAVPIFYILIYLLPVFNQIRATVAEKETRVAEGMLIMGMNEACRQTMWMVVYGLQQTLVGLIVAVSLCNSTGAFGRSDFSLVFLLLFFYGLAVTAFGNFIALFFERAKTAAVIGSFLFILGIAPFMTVLIISQTKVPEWGQLLACLMVPSAFGLGIAQITAYQAAGNGLTWSNMFVLVNNMRFGHTLYMLVFDTVLLLVLAWWVDKWNPLRTIGTKHRPWFCVLPQYWCPRSSAATWCRKTCERSHSTEEDDDHKRSGADGSVAPAETVGPEPLKPAKKKKRRGRRRRAGSGESHCESRGQKPL